jgi:hypothetical protein
LAVAAGRGLSIHEGASDWDGRGSANLNQERNYAK